MKNFIVVCLFVCVSINTLALHGLAQNSSSGGGNGSLAQWPSKFPYPPEFPLSGEGVYFEGAGDESGPFIAVYTSNSTWLAPNPITVIDKLQYEYQEYTNADGALVRRKLRHTWEKRPSFDFRQTTRTGFTELSKSEVTPNRSFASIKTTYHDWDYNPWSGGPIVYTENTRFCHRILSQTPTTTTKDCVSERTRVYNSRYPSLFPRNEKITVVFTDNASSWALVRKYKSTFGEKVKEEAEIWPNSGGNGSSAIAEFEILPEIELSHPFGKDVLTMADAFQYLFFLWDQSLPWNIEPF